MSRRKGSKAEILSPTDRSHPRQTSRQSSRPTSGASLSPRTPNQEDAQDGAEERNRRGPRSASRGQQRRISLRSPVSPAVKQDREAKKLRRPSHASVKGVGSRETPDISIEEVGITSPAPPLSPSLAKKVRMGKKVEKALAKDKSQTVTEGTEEDPNKSPVPYECTGHFSTDFHELCRRTGMAVIPPVIPRPHRPPSPVTIPSPDEKTKTGKKDTAKNQPPPPPEPEQEQELGENREPVEPPPKTYTTKDKFEYFKPCVQVEMEHPDKQDTVTEVFIRGWKVDESMMSTLNQCLPKVQNLKSVNLWNSGLTSETLKSLAKLVEECPSLTNLVLDNNPVAEEEWHLLLQPESPVERLSLRHNKITDKGAALIAKALGTTTTANHKLLVLNLNGNGITDTGVASLCQGLRTNRSLLSLSLGNNKIGDAGAKKLGEVLSRFELTHEEILERRKLMSSYQSPERLRSASDQKGHPHSDRPNTALSSTAGGKDSKASKSAKPKKDAKGGKEEDKHDKKGKKDDKNQKKGSVVAETKSAPKKGEKTKGKGGKGASVSEAEPDSPETANPLTDKVEIIEPGKVILPGNRALINLNLAYNQIGEEGINALLMAVRYQTTLSHDSSHIGRSGNSGLLRLSIHKNKGAAESTALKQLHELMESKDPMAPPPSTEE